MTGLVLATRNDHKVREFARLLDVEVPPETGTTFAETAL